MRNERECAAHPGKVDRANAEFGKHILPHDRAELEWDLCGLAVAVPFGLMFLYAAAVL